MFVDCCVIQTNSSSRPVFKTTTLSPADFEVKVPAPGKQLRGFASCKSHRCCIVSGRVPMVASLIVLKNKNVKPNIKQIEVNCEKRNRDCY